jgi:hypothetical protein
MHKGVKQIMTEERMARLEGRMASLETKVTDINTKLDSVGEMVSLGKHLVLLAKVIGWVGGLYIAVSTYIQTVIHK